ncbi:MAG: S-layer homology domain-containing protein, partial [Oscillospiraceae bacterium]|nr:S-layer homology domain-containing protein [Oscillospiraceae bacterium]
VGGIEVYSSYNYAYIDIRNDDSAEATVNGGAALTAAGSEMDRSAAVHFGEALAITVTPDSAEAAVYAYQDGRNVTNDLVNAAGVWTLTLAGGIDEDTEFVFSVGKPLDTAVTPGGPSQPDDGKDKTETETLPDGTVVTTVTRKDGVVIVARSAPAGGTTATVTVPAGYQGGEALIPTAKTSSGNVAYEVKADGSKVLIRKSYVTSGGVWVPITGSVKLEIADNGKSFADVAQTAWYSGAVTFASSHELFLGTDATHFSPDLPMTRAMLATVLHRLENEPKKGSNIFNDVPDDTWFTQSTAWAADAGIIQGVGGGKFDPDGNITREAMVVMIYRYAKYLGMNTAGSAGLSAFSDAGSVSDWAEEALAWGVHAKLIEGSGNKLNPGGSATRAEVATIFMRLVAAFYQ